MVNTLCLLVSLFTILQLHGPTAAAPIEGSVLGLEGRLEKLEQKIEHIVALNAKDEVHGVDCSMQCRYGTTTLCKCD